MTDLLDKHSEEYDPDAFTAMVDDQRKAEKENALDAVIPPPKQIVNTFTGEVIDRDDLPALEKALAEVEEFLNEKVWARHRRVFETQRRLRARVGELKPIDLPKRRDQSAAQRRLAECPHCRTRLPQTFIEEAE